VAVPALELFVLTVQHVSTCLELLPKHLVAPPCSLWRVLWLARDAVKQYGVSPHHLPATCHWAACGSLWDLDMQRCIRLVGEG
jgi:hypothetical protein